MISREEYEKTFVRMMDSIRENGKGRANCNGVDCTSCPFSIECAKDDQSNPFKAAFFCEIVEQWGKEHPVITNGKKFEEVFGMRRYENECFKPISEKCACGHCSTCKYGPNGEYHAPEGEKK